MALSAVLNSARSSLAALSERTRTVSENIANVDNPDYSRRIASNVAGRHGVLRVSTSRAADAEILAQMLEYSARQSADATRADGLDKLGLIYGDVDSEVAPPALLSRLRADMQALASAPDSATAAARAVGTARDLVNAINRGAETVADIRRQADAEIGQAVAHVNDLLRQFHEANAALMTGRLSDTERVQNEDTRDRVLVALSEELDIRTVRQADGGMAIYTTDGAVLYERGVRPVRYEPTPALVSGAPGGRVIIDNVPVTGDGAVMKLKSGHIAGLLRLRDDVAASWQVQLDELARGLVETFAEQDQSGSGLPDAAGLFTWSGAPALPPAGAHQPGLARELRLNPLVDPQAGGNPFLLRDGGLAGAAYVYNASGQAGYTDRLLQLAGALDAPRAFDAAAGLEPVTSIADFARQAVSWLQENRAQAHREKDYSTALLSRASDALSRATGVDLDQELTVMMQLERTYQATARVLSTVNGMLDSLMQSMR